MTENEQDVRIPSHQANISLCTLTDWHVTEVDCDNSRMCRSKSRGSGSHNAWIYVHEYLLKRSGELSKNLEMKKIDLVSNPLG